MERPVLIFIQRAVQDAVPKQHQHGVYIRADGSPVFRRVEPPTMAEMEKLIHRISHRIGRYLERAGLLVRDMENSYLTLEARDGSAMDPYRSFHHLPGCGRSTSGAEGVHAADDTGAHPGTR